MSGWSASNIQVGKAIRHIPISTLAPLTDPPIGPQYENGLQDISTKLLTTEVLGGFIGGGSLAWRASGPTLEILDPKTCIRKAAWTFGAILRNTSAVVNINS